MKIRTSTLSLACLILTLVAATGACSKSSEPEQAPFQAPGTAPPDAPPPANPNARYSWIDSNVLQPKCVSCHGSRVANSGINLETYAAVFGSTATFGKPVVVPSSATTSPLYMAVESGAMPRNGNALSAEELTAINDWINAGAFNN